MRERAGVCRIERVGIEVCIVAQRPAQVVPKEIPDFVGFEGY